jgi:demethylmenaquinone methyltransferase/2-methoxy-6-polyprenyl-1,4-benzoquinol methylase
LPDRPDAGKINPMAEVKPYSESGSKKEQVSNMFDNIAHYYDFLNHFLSLGIDRGWRRKAIGSLRGLAPARLLDVATGTADLALEAHRQLAPISIVGVDISPKMLEKGRIKIEGRKLSDSIVLEDGDSENLRFSDASFDAVTVAFGVRNFENLRRGLAEMHRVLRPGGQLVVLEFSKPVTAPFKQLFHLYFRYMLPFIGKFTSKDPRAYAYLYESVQAFPDGAAFVGELTSVGFRQVEAKSLTLGICSVYLATKSA